tara:strand:+ start:162 stop:1049 length:888 start_codon:yes stop_codon:yes gene_type:complete
MNLINKLENYWKLLEGKYSPPKYVGDVKDLDFKKLKKAIDNKDEKFLKTIIKKMYVEKEAYILKNCAKKNLKTIMLNLTKIYKSNRRPSFYKMLEGVPNFHRAIDKKITKKYSLYAIKHSFYFYNWNIKTKLEKALKDGVYWHWRYIKFLAGNNMKKYEFNTPKDGQIDRLQIVRYPSGGGQLRDHVDSRKNQRVVSGIVMSKKGVDYKEGGFYFNKTKSKRINLENRIDQGDAVIFYGSLVHGVEAIDPKEKLSWKSDKGRWFLGMFVNDSDHVKNRITSQDLTGSIKKNFNKN